ncbi:MAG: hypothetical protein HFJ08_03795 [Lachnospiraceae bacterium]|nr:hypothetical protein [Lachnospiraceae bacterium]
MVFSKEELKGIKFHKEDLVKYVFAVAIILMGVYKVSELAMPIIFNDEFGYWSNSMLLSGRDWSSITNRISYYSYGYSIILCIVRKTAEILGYGWADRYKVAVIYNVIFIVLGYLLSVKIANRYLKHIHKYMIPVVCFVAAIYPSNMIYTHITMTECTLTFLFWLLAYVMMRAIDKPNIANHIGLAFLNIYIYAVHQRTIGLIITVVIVVLILRMLKINSLLQTIVYFCSVYIFYVLHSMLKLYIKSVNYMGSQSLGIAEIVKAIFTKQMFIILIAISAIIIWLYLLDKGKVKLCLGLIVVAVIACIIGLNRIGIAVGNSTDHRLSVNELSGQIGVLKGIFSKYGLIRLGTSIVGKWYYLAAATGLVICWGLRDLLLNAIVMFIDGCKRVVYAVRGKEHIAFAKLNDDFKAHIFFVSMFFAFAGAFMICAIYKEGLYTNDDLINGRYIEYLIGFVLIYSIDRILADRHWLLFWLIFAGAFFAAGMYCDYVLEQVHRKGFELIHAVAFSEVFVDNEVPIDKAKEVIAYVLPRAVGFIVVLKVGTSKWKIKNPFADRQILSKPLVIFSTIWKKFMGKLGSVRLLLALLIPLVAWKGIYTNLIDDYVVVRNKILLGAAPDIASWIERLAGENAVYFDQEGLYYRKAEMIQYMCEDKKIILEEFGDMDFHEDALFILNIDSLNADIIKVNCEVVCTKGSYALVINKYQDLMERLQLYREAMNL